MEANGWKVSFQHRTKRIVVEALVQFLRAGQQVIPPGHSVLGSKSARLLA